MDQLDIQASSPKFCSSPGKIVSMSSDRLSRATEVLREADEVVVETVGSGRLRAIPNPNQPPCILHYPEACHSAKTQVLLHMQYGEVVPQGRVRMAGVGDMGSICPGDDREVLPAIAAFAGK
eukprot:scaffold95203_cov32-Prasinocladus_malaysianus.AAC.5